MYSKVFLRNQNVLVLRTKSGECSNYFLKRVMLLVLCVTRWLRHKPETDAIPSSFCR